MDDEDVQTDVADTRAGWRHALWHKPLSEWWAATTYLAGAALELAAGTAALLLAATLIVCQTLTWRDGREGARR